MFFTACGGGGGGYTRSVHGTQGGYSFKNVRARPANLLVARKIERPLCVVLDPGRVKDTWPVSTPGCAVGASCEHFQIFDVHEFVRRDLKNALANYFTHVEIVGPQEVLPNSSAYVLADVKVDDIKLRNITTGRLTYTLIQMTWGFAMRRSEETDYTYSFAGTSESQETYPTFEAGCAQLVENAIPAMLKKWTEGGGVQAFQK